MTTSDPHPDNRAYPASLSSIPTDPATGTRAVVAITTRTTCVFLSNWASQEYLIPLLG